ncbi:MAG: NAD(P)-dependent oxidoreductase [bacterium]
MALLKGKRVMVTGAAGFIGANLVRRLLLSGAEVHALLRPTSRLWRVEDLFPSLRRHSVDLADFSTLKETVRAVKPEIIFHLATESGHPATESERDAALKSNLLGTAYLLESVEPIPYEHFIHFGSSLEYGPKNHALRETDLPEPVTYRGATKAAAALLCRQFACAGNRPMAILRPFSVYGCWEGPKRFIPTALAASLQGREISLTAPDLRHDFIFVEDVLDACFLALEKPDLRGDIFNIGSGRQVTNKEVIEIIEKIAHQKIKVSVKCYPTRLHDTDFWLADIQKAKTILNWSPRYSLEEGLQKTLSWLERHPSFYSGNPA